MFKLQLTNLTTKETLWCLGQGATVDEAVKDALANLRAPFRPKADGKSRVEQRVNVTNEHGVQLYRTLKEFCGEETFMEQLKRMTEVPA